MINTKKCKDRRQLRFENVQQALSEAEALALSEREGKLRAGGNWKLGQTLGHLAFWANAPFDGYPEMQRPLWFIRVLIPLFKKRFFHSGMPAGIRIPGTAEGTFGLAAMDTEQGLAQLRRALERLAVQAPARPHPLLGKVSHDDWINLSLRHAELHLSFFHPC